jgi:glycosyltransferase involved in cell wall biosynthesis
MGAPWRRQFREVLESDLAERAAIRRHRYLVASSPVIATALRRRAPSSEIVLSPLSLDPADYVPAPLDGPPTAGIIGTAGWPPTASAMKNLVTRIWPAVQTRVPEARLLVAGRGTSGLALPDGRHVEVLGEVESARQFFRQLSVLLYPLDQGSGMKVKVLESIASGVPVVTTPSGSEGIDAESGIVVETDDRRLADAAVAILSDAEERRERGRTARASFERLYTPAAATAPLADLYRRMVES